MENILDTNKQTISSIEIADITQKKHYHIMRDIRELLEQGVQKSNFGLSFIIKELPNGGSKKVSYYTLTKKGSLILASGYDAILREKIIDRWEELEIKERYTSQTSVIDSLETTFRFIEWQAKFLNLDKYSKLSLLKKIADPMGLPTINYADYNEVSAPTTRISRKYQPISKPLSVDDEIWLFFDNYFADPTHLNCPVSVNELLYQLSEFSPTPALKLIRKRHLRKILIMYCHFNKLVFNPDKFLATKSDRTRKERRLSVLITKEDRTQEYSSSQEGCWYVGEVDVPIRLK